MISPGRHTVSSMATMTPRRRIGCVKKPLLVADLDSDWVL
jgi:hypothetical protein